MTKFNFTHDFTTFSIPSGTLVFLEEHCSILPGGRKMITRLTVNFF